MPLSRKNVFVAGTPILASEWLEELGQIYEFLSGRLAGQILLTQNTPNKCLIIQNSAGSAVVLEAKKGGGIKAQFLNNQQFKSLITGIAPFDVASITKVTNLNAQFLDGKALSVFVLSGGTPKVNKYIPFLLQDDAFGLSTGLRTFDYIVPAGTNMSITEVKFDALQGVGFPAQDLQVGMAVRKNDIDIATALLGVNNQWSETDSISTSVAENDAISVHITSVSGTTVAADIVIARTKFIQDLV